MVGMLQKNLLQIENKIKENLPTGVKPPQIVAVSKKQSVEKITQLYELGVRNFAENYLQEAKEKMDILKNLSIRWHFIGNLQSKKIKDIVGNFDLIHSVERIEIAEKNFTKIFRDELSPRGIITS